jgi:hypothetical protein
MSNLESKVRIDDEILVLGNSGGGGVVTNLTGRVVGIGPDRIEVSAEFIPGNSGSPIVHVPTGKVIGIATYLIQRYDGVGRRSVESVRHFGFRLDSVKKWEPVNWMVFYAEAERLQQISALTSDVIGFLEALRVRHEPEFATETLRRPAVDWYTTVRRPRTSLADRERACTSFLAALRAMVRNDVAAAESQLRYSYFREELAKEREVRDALYKDFDTELKRLASPSGRVF